MSVNGLTMPNVAGSSVVPLIMAPLSTASRRRSAKKEARLPIGPLRFPPASFSRNGAFSDA